MLVSMNHNEIPNDKKQAKATTSTHASSVTAHTPGEWKSETIQN